LWSPMGSWCQMTNDSTKGGCASGVRCSKNIWPRHFIVIPLFIFFNLLLLAGCGDITSSLGGLSLSPASVTVGVRQSQAFTAVFQSSSGTLSQASPTWSVSGNIGTISVSTGLYVAGSTAGTGYVIATAGTVTGQAAVTVTANGWIAGKVTGERDTSGVDSVAVRVRGTSYVDSTDPTGHYSIANVPPGDYEIYTDVTPIYESASAEVTVASGETTTHYFLLTVRAGVPEIPTTTIFAGFSGQETN